MSCCFLLQGIFPTQDSNLCLLHWQTDSLQLVPPWKSLPCSVILTIWIVELSLLLLSCSVAQSCATLCDPMDCSTPGLPVLHHLSEPAQTHVHWVGDAIQPSHSLLSRCPPAFNLSEHQGLFRWVDSSHQIVQVFLKGRHYISREIFVKQNPIIYPHSWLVIA